MSIDRPPSRRTSSRRLCVLDAAPHPGAVASADSARKTNCNDIPRDALAGILPRLTAVSDDDAVAVAHECRSSPAGDAASPFASEPVGSQTTWLPVPLR